MIGNRTSSLINFLATYWFLRYINLFHLDIITVNVLHKTWILSKLTILVSVRLSAIASPLVCLIIVDNMWDGCICEVNLVSCQPVWAVGLRVIFVIHLVGSTVFVEIMTIFVFSHIQSRSILLYILLNTDVRIQIFDILFPFRPFVKEIYDNRLISLLLLVDTLVLLPIAQLFLVWLAFEVIILLISLFHCWIQLLKQILALVGVLPRHAVVVRGALIIESINRISLLTEPLHLCLGVNLALVSRICTAYLWNI